MGTIIPRRRADGSTAYLAQILKKQDGRIVHRESRTFDRKAVAKAWIEKREADIAAPGGLERAQTPKGTLHIGDHPALGGHSNFASGIFRSSVRASKTSAMAESTRRSTWLRRRAAVTRIPRWVGCSTGFRMMSRRSFWSMDRRPSRESDRKGVSLLLRGRFTTTIIGRALPPTHRAHHSSVSFLGSSKSPST